ncbi:hypothetical protein CR513_05180, partial [Mucuna pruriens]
MVKMFERKYRNLLSLVNIEVHPAALLALIQYYDLPLRCFTFQGFQLAPTLEEYERLLGIPCDKSPPYLFRGHYLSWALVARLLKVLESKVLKLKENRNIVEGIPEAALEKRLQQLQEEEDWQAIDAEWTAHLDEATKRSIRWYPLWNEREDVIIWCGRFPNIPLMGTQGAINCNPKSTLRQARYSEEAVAPFIIHDLGIRKEST